MICLFPCSEEIAVGYEPEYYTVRESGGYVILIVRVLSYPTTGAPQPFNLSVNTVDGTASEFNYVCII